MEHFIKNALNVHDRMSKDENYRKEIAARATLNTSYKQIIQLDSIDDVYLLQRSSQSVLSLNHRLN